jgi:hypothetical protein
VATEYRLTLAGEAPAEQVAERLLPDPAADLYDRYGFDVVIRAGRKGYFDAESDTGLWQWEPEAYVMVNFRTGRVK